MTEGIALRYRSLGVAVFALAPNDKRPLIPKSEGGRGCHDATLDIETIEGWWKRCPKANVGIATGPISGIWVLDIDPFTSEMAADWIKAMEERHGPLPPTPEAKTLKGGRHLVFKWNPDYPVGNRCEPRDSEGQKIRGLDARGDGGYIVAPPSHVRQMKDGKLWEGDYQWLAGKKLSDIPPPDAPQWLLDVIVHKKQAQTQVDFVPRERREGDGFRYGHKALDEECREIITAQPGGQNNQIVSSSYKIGQLVAGGEIPHDEARDALINAAMAIPGQSKDLAYITDAVDRAFVAGQGNARSAPARPEYKARPQLRVVGGTERVDPETGEVTEDEPAPQGDKWFDRADWAMGLNWSLTDKGGLKPSSLSNAELMLENHPALRGHLSLNEFSFQNWIFGGLPCDKIEPPDREMQDNDEVALASWLARVGLTPGVQMMGQVMRLIASRNSFDPVQNYLSALVWDGKRRLDTWLTTYAGAENNEYSTMVGAKFLISAVARALEPGCKVDTMLVLEGPQGLKKSTLARTLFGSDWFSDQVGEVATKESSQQIQGMWCIEVSEMDAFTKSDDRAVKAFLSRTEDRYRPTYGRNTITRPRRCVFIGTYNPDGSGITKDATGARRYWFVTCTAINIIELRKDRDQLWAEAVARYRAIEHWWLEPEEEEIAKHEQEARQIEDLWDRKIRDYVMARSPDEYFTNAVVVEEALMLPLDKRDQRVEKRVGAILTRLGCQPVRPYRANGSRYRAWARPAGLLSKVFSVGEFSPLAREERKT